MTAQIRHRPPAPHVPEVWSTSCCTAYADSDLVPKSGNPGTLLFTTEANAVRSLSAHLADEHGVMVVREMTVTDVESCGDCATGTVFGGFGCQKCDWSGEIRTERTVTVDQHTVEDVA